MGWATAYIARLQAGEVQSFRPHGHSMSPRIVSGQLCTVVPLAGQTLDVGDVVLCRVGEAEYLHLIRAIESGRYLIGNNHGKINGWVAADAVFGKLIKLAP
jgi:hypothetical protein